MWPSVVFNIAAITYPPLAIPGIILSSVGGKGLLDFARLAIDERKRIARETEMLLAILLDLKGRQEGPDRQGA